MSLDFDEVKEKRLFSLMSTQAGALNASNGALRFAELKNYLSAKLKEAQSRSWKIVIIAGTNGKGETAHSLYTLALRQGLNSALWTSPHILSLRERFCFDGKDISYEELEVALEEEFKEQKKQGFFLGYYETLFSVFLSLALKKNPELLILEVGLGGRFDAVNLMNPALCLITSIGRDHEEFLGRGHRRILAEKLGVTRPQVPLLTCLELGFQREVCRQFVLGAQVPWTDLFEEGIVVKADHYSKRNRLLALQAFQRLVGKTLSLEVLSGLSFKGRGEKLQWRDQNFFFIGAHNHDGVRKMVEGLKSGHLLNDFSCPFDTILVSFSKRSVEEIEACLRLLARDWRLAHHVVLTSFEHAKAMDGKTLSKFKGLVDFEADWKTILPKLKGTVLVTGSYYFVGEVQRHFASQLSSKL